MAHDAAADDLPALQRVGMYMLVGLLSARSMAALQLM